MMYCCIDLCGFVCSQFSLTACTPSFIKQALMKQPSGTSISANSLAACQDFCQQESSCASLDYQTTTNQCYTHNTVTTPVSSGSETVDNYRKNLECAGCIIVPVQYFKMNTIKIIYISFNGNKEWMMFRINRHSLISYSETVIWQKLIFYNTFQVAATRIIQICATRMATQCLSTTPFSPVWTPVRVIPRACVWTSGPVPWCVTSSTPSSPWTWSQQAASSIGPTMATSPAPEQQVQ